MPDAFALKSSEPLAAKEDDIKCNTTKNRLAQRCSYMTACLLSV